MKTFRDVEEAHKIVEELAKERQLLAAHEGEALLEYVNIQCGAERFANTKMEKRRVLCLARELVSERIALLEKQLRDLGIDPAEPNIDIEPPPARSRAEREGVFAKRKLI